MKTVSDNHYLVSWTIDLWGGSPVSAAKQARKIQQDPASIAVVFQVKPDDGRTVEVDMANHPPEADKPALMKNCDGLIDVNVATDSEYSRIEGRNGTFRIKRLRVWESHDRQHVYIDALGKRDVAIHGGMMVTKPCFEEVCRQYLNRANLKPILEETFCKAHGDACCDICKPEGEGDDV